MTDLRSQPWWTEADRAELDVVVHLLVDGLAAHEETGCTTCEAGYPPCPKVTRAIEAVVEWRDRRVLTSKAAWLRAIQDHLDLDAA